MLGIAATGRAVILPRMLCYCDYMWRRQELQGCGAETMLPFDCPMDHVLDTPRWFESGLGVEVRALPSKPASAGQRLVVNRED